jgi:lipopolysaccharide transport system permease protein
LRRFRFLLRELVLRDLKVRYAGSLLGFIWAFVHPLWQLAIYSAVFSGILKTPLDGEGTKSFPVFLFAGLLMWMSFGEGLSRGTATVVESANLVSKLRFPSSILVVAVTLSALLHASIATGVFLIIRIAVGGVVWAALPGFLLATVLQYALTLGLAWLLAAVYVFLRDIQHVLTLVLSAVFYLTPIVYPPAIVPHRYQWMVAANPLSTLVALYRAFLVGSKPPAGGAVLVLAVVAVAALALGSIVFSRLSGQFADEL